jgi:hypothetical protein
MEGSFLDGGKSKTRGIVRGNGGRESIGGTVEIGEFVENSNTPFGINDVQRWRD